MNASIQATTKLTITALPSAHPGNLKWSALIARTGALLLQSAPSFVMLSLVPDWIILTRTVLETRLSGCGGCYL
ncbi:MAG: hypothetical protein ABL862_04285 [Candidatus Nitrotoga sp.]